jgi:hypothetical protein
MSGRARTVSDEVLCFLREHWNDKTISVDEIAIKVGLSYNAVRGLAYRLGLRGRKRGPLLKCECGVCKRCRALAEHHAYQERKKQGLIGSGRVKVSLFGEIFTIREIIEILGISRSSIVKARKRGVWSDEWAVRTSKRAIRRLRAKTTSRFESWR